MIPRMAIEPESIATFPEAPPTLGRHECGEGGDHGRVPSRPIDQWPVVGGPPQSHRSAGPLNRQATHGHQMGGDLPAVSGP